MPSSGLQKHPYTCGQHTKETGWKPELRNYTNSNDRPFEVFLSSLSQILKNISNYKLGSESLRRAPPSSCCSRVSLGLRTWPKTSRLKSRKDHPFDSGFPNTEPNQKLHPALPGLQPPWDVVTTVGMSVCVSGTKHTQAHLAHILCLSLGWPPGRRLISWEEKGLGSVLSGQ